MNQPLDGLRADYDLTPYTSDAFPQSAPPQLAAIAHVFGLQAPAVAQARVLEIGCAAGGNLMPFAATHPGAQVVGVDLSQVQVDQGRIRAQALGLDNVQFVAGDIAQLDTSAWGRFDFVIAHGVYSWVPPNVQDAILATIRRVLAPEGIAYLSYNVYPGWKSKEVMRDAMMLASGASTTPQDKAREARAMAGFLEEVAPPDGVLARVLAEFRSRDEGFGDSYLLHDELESFNAPCYFYEMVGRAGAHGLTYLAEARPETMFPSNHGPKVAEYLAEKCSGVQVLVEQYLDFVTNRSFRESLLIHAERAPQIRYDLQPSLFSPLHVAAWTPAVDGPTRMDHSRQEYEVADGATLFTNDPGLKATLEALNARWPWTQSRLELIKDVRTRLVAAGFEPSADLASHVDNLLGVLMAQGQARYRLDPVLPEKTSTEQLQLDPTTRRLAELTRDQDDASIFNLWHEALLPSPVDRHLLPLLDGTRDATALLDTLTAIAGERSLPIERDGEPVPHDEIPEALAEAVDTLPQRLVEMKLIRVD
ncbi:class I SAM-dependent methyltransferase [Mycolicibacterium sp.]|uniref:class I SAM-dependent methyltransferase n=1 Tax=Mycolicibacterium sp. TaxID=2320850 RepID=UPI001A2960D5|nr:class I SAM-dependent methyltransferase [Mycolicibacterium sp.]MBJ7337887.1 class I SAM-dependent methyltransferase [Mycolicibacterium sp.]